MSDRSDRRRGDRGSAPRDGRGAPGGSPAERFERRSPAGIERAARRPGVPPPQAASRRAGSRVRKPPIPASAEVDLPGEVRGDIRRHAQHDDEVAKAVTIATDALENGDVDRALTYLEWAKSDAPRSSSIREALGIALYLAERWGEALSELQAYRRLSGRSDQNHLVADCLRALDRPLEAVGEAVRAMDPGEDGLDRVAEGRIVWASALADAGDTTAGRAVLDEVLHMVDVADEEADEHHVRVWYVAGDLAERDGDADEARRWFARVHRIDPELFEVDARLRALGS